ncbi:MAG: PD-(D/E)XK nuclease family protein, partial [Lachnospiraceae bacterium]|nr:PD-(D/E)XK nuclease family protein [Lachnospiraceae bacterium]
RAMPEGSVRLENIRRLILLAEQYEKTSYSGLYRFISYIERQKELEMDRSPGGVGESTDAVRIMTVHAAKGLEFPVVLLVGTSRGFSFADASGSLLIHEDLGAVPGTADTEKRVIGPNLRRTLASRQIREEILAEKLRVLYVALTRAGSRLIVCSAAKEPEKFEADADAPAPGPLPAWRLRSAGSFLSWLGLLREAGVMPKPRIIRPEDLAAAEEDSRREEEKLQLQAARLREEALQGLTGAAEEELRRRMQWTYPHEASLEIRGVYSVSEIKSLQGEAKTRSRVPRYFLTQPLTEAEEVPDAEALTAASRGTAYHKVLQYLPIGPETEEEAGIRRFLEQMQAEGRLSAPEAAAVDPAHLAAFRKSVLGQRIRRAAERDRVFREQPFLLGVPSPEIFPGTDASETILIQGIIDLFFEEEDGLVLVDYKTDRVQNTAELWERYAVQMQLYRRALEQATGKPVRESVIWSLVLDRGSGPS